MLSVFADYFDFRGMELVKLKDELNLLKFHLGRGSVWRIQLDDDDELPVEITSGGITEWTYPTTVTGEFSTGTKTLTRVEDLETLLWSVPDEIVLDESIAVGSTPVIWESTAPTVFNTIEEPDRLQVVIENSTDYLKKTRFKNRAASGYHRLIIEGKDENGISVIEHLLVRDDGMYLTKNIFTEISAVDGEGFDGDIFLYVATPVTSTRMLVDPYHIAMTDRVEGPLKLALSGDVLQYYVQRIKRGENYRTGGTEVVDNDDIVWEQALADTGGTAVSGIVDVAIHPDTGRLYALTSAGVVYVYDFGLTEFTPPVDEDDVTKETYVEVQPLKHWATLNESMTMFTHFVKPRYVINGVTIKRRDPSGNVEYLQSGLTWAAGVYEFSGNDPENALPEETWTNLTFQNIFDEYGEWEFYCTTRTNAGNSTMVTKVMVDKLTAAASYGIFLLSSYALYFNADGQLCVMTNPLNYSVSKYDLHSHVYLANGASQQLFFREDYTSVEVIP